MRAMILLLIGSTMVIRSGLSAAIGSDAIPSPVQRQGHPAAQIPPDAAKLFHQIETALATGALHPVSDLFASVVQINVHGEAPGSYSSAQAASILINYFLTRKALAFSFTYSGMQGNSPFATGRLDVVRGGTVVSEQVYVCLRSAGSRWVIHQFNIY